MVPNSSIVSRTGSPSGGVALSSVFSSPGLVGLGQRASADPAPKPHLVEVRPLRVQTRFDIAQTLAVGQLSESHGQELIRTGEGPESSIPVVSFDTAPELLRVNLLHHLRKGGLDRGHAARYHPGFEPPNCFAEKIKSITPFESINQLINRELVANKQVGCRTAVAVNREQRKSLCKQLN